MPPKKIDKGQQKAVEKQKQKIAEDKTFGLKNKNKSKSVQKFIKGIQQTAKGQTVGDAVLKAQELSQKEEKKKQLQQAALLASLFKNTESVKKLGDEDLKLTDPASIKADQQIDVYTDQRTQKKGDTMEDWDQTKLEEVIRTKHSASEAKATAIVCKYFIDALERRQYGWFWTCPNGGDSCKYKHCLPPGYVLARDAPSKDAADEEDDETIEEKIEKERANLPPGGTKLTLELFTEWLQKREDETYEAVKMAALKASDSKAYAHLSGKALFTFNPSLFVDDAAAADEGDYQEDETHWEEIARENQMTVDRANEEAQKLKDQNNDDSKKVDQKESSSCCTAEASNIFVGREALFLEEDDPILTADLHLNLPSQTFVRYLIGLWNYMVLRSGAER